MKHQILGFILCSVAVAGCAPQFIEVPPAKRTSVWVERDAIATHEAIGNAPQKVVALTDTVKDQRLSAEERVTWVSGVDLKKSRLQRTTERLGEAEAESNALRSASRAGIVETHTFQVMGESIAVGGQLALQRFKATAGERFYVEFLNEGAMTEERVNKMLAAWKDLSAKLKVRGLDTASLVMGGAKYDQRMNAIVLVKVGK